MRLILSITRLILPMHADAWSRQNGSVATRDGARLSLFFTGYLQAAGFF
jgi:hypothetical protein